MKSKFIKVLFVILALLFLFNTFSFIIVNLESDKCEKFESNLKPSSEENILYYDWMQTWSENNFPECRAMTKDNLDNIYLGGITSDNNREDSCIIKYNSDGIQQFNITWSGSSDDDVCNGIAVDLSYNIYITGFMYEKIVQSYVKYQIYLAKFNSTGNYEWHTTWKRFSNGVDTAYGIALDSSNNIYVVGTSSDEQRHQDIVLIKFNNMGVEMWNRTWGGNDTDNGYEILIDDSNNIYITGRTASFGSGRFDMYLIKYNDMGEQLWNRTWGGSDDEGANDLILDSSNNIYLAGTTESYSNGDSDFALVKFDVSGNFQWYRTYGGAGADISRTISCDSSDNIYIGGELEGSSWKYCKIGIAKYSPSGEMKLNVTWGSEKYGQEESYRNKCYGIEIDSSNNIYIGGFVEGSHIYLMKCDSEFGIGKAKEVLFTEDIEFSRRFNTFLEKDPFQNFYSDETHTASISFGVIGYLNYFIIILFDKNIVNNIDIITVNKEHQNETIHTIQLYEEMNFSYDSNILFSFYFNYTYTYEYCIDWDDIFCYESDYTSKSGDYLSDEYIITRNGISRYSPSPSSSIPASLLLFLSVMMVGVLLEITYVQRKKRK